MIDRYDAPEGEVAIRMLDDCEPCCYYDPKDETGVCSHDGWCRASKRKDGESVYFVKREDFEKMLIKEIEGFYKMFFGGIQQTADGGISIHLRPTMEIKNER